MPRKIKPTHLKKRRGAAAVELAVVLPIFFLIIFGIVEFGRVMMVMQVVTNAAREGARACAVGDMTVAEVQTLCEEYASGAMVPNVQVEITPDPVTVNRGDPFEVRVFVNFNEVAFLPPFWAKESVLQSRSTMRKERESSSQP
ncbi:MAG: TadE/TadG family type IV pilus assembly protein [Mariniblastus sp.]